LLPQRFRVEEIIAPFPNPPQNEQQSSNRNELPAVGEMTIVDYIKREKYKKPWYNQACVTIPRILFGSNSSGANNNDSIQEGVPAGFDVNDFDTMRYRVHADINNWYANLYDKVIVDVNRIADNVLQNPAYSIHRPYLRRCPYPDSCLDESMLKVNHYLGSFEAYSSRSDVRRSAEFYNKKASLIDGGTDDDIRPWIKHFVGNVGEESAHNLTSNLVKFISGGDKK